MIKEQKKKPMVLITLLNLKLHIFAIMGYLFNKIKSHQSFQN